MKKDHERGPGEYRTVVFQFVVVMGGIRHCGCRSPLTWASFVVEVIKLVGKRIKGKKYLGCGDV